MVAYQTACTDLVQFYKREYDGFVERLPAGSPEPPRQKTDEVGEEGQVGSLVAERNSADVGATDGGPVGPSEPREAKASVSSTKSDAFTMMIGLGRR